MSGQPPHLSVVVPVYNGEAFLDRCLGALSQSEFRGYECIVVDDGSEDDSAAIARRHGANVVSLDHRNGPARARNRGVAVAGGEIVVFLDADVCVRPGTLGRVAAYFREHPSVDAVIGSYDDTPTEQNLVSQYKNLSHHFVHQRSRTEAWTFWAGCGAIRKRAFVEVGGFDESYTRPSIEDIELGSRLQMTGHAINLDPTIQVKHLKRWTLPSLIRTDLLDRGVPWFELILRNREMPADLNLTVAHRWNIAFLYTAVLLMGIAACGVRPLETTLLAAVLFTVMLVLDYPLYAFFSRRRGLGFALASIPLQCLYYGYCGLAVILGLATHLRSVAGGPDLDS